MQVSVGVTADHVLLLEAPSNTRFVASRVTALAAGGKNARPKPRGAAIPPL
jgi:hypothetical protein